MRSGRDERYEPVPLPKRFATRNESVFRSFGPGHLSIGFQYKPNRSIDVVDLPWSNYAAIFILRGAGRYIDWQGREQALGAGDLFQRLHGKKHTVYIDPASDWLECWIDIDPELARQLALRGVLDLNRAVLRPGLDLAMVERHERELLALRAAREADLPRRFVALTDILVDWYERDRARGAPDPVATIVEEACRALAAGAAERALVATVLRGSGLSYERFRKVFRARMGVSPGAYRIRRRLERARELLLMSGRTVAAIADELGYANQFAFSQQFKRAVGVPPDAYRRRLPGGR